jgi:DNA-binding CsgD family transcriptional regulator
MLAQSTARAMDHVQLGILSHVTAADFAEPHGPERLADLQARLDPVIAGLSANASGAVEVELIAADGTIIYSDKAELIGGPTPDGQIWLLDEALAGRVTTSFGSTRERARGSEDAAENRIYDVYVPVSMDGEIVGAYELDVDLPASRLNQPILVTLLGGLLAAALYLVVRLTVGPARRPDRPPAAEPVREAPPVQLHDAQPDFEALGRLTRRELDVLRSLATGRSYREIATELIVGEETIRSHVKRILRKTGHPNRTALVTAAHRAGIIDPAPPSATRELAPVPGPALISGPPPGQAPIARIHPGGGRPKSADSPAQVVAAREPRI